MPMDSPVANKNRQGEWGEWRPTSQGYIRRSRTLNGIYEYQLQHREVLAQVIGRPLLPEESAHHKNGDRSDNRPENLELWSKSQPAGQRVEDKVAWAFELLSLYSPGVLK